jgi:hypothetical protein
MAGIALPVGAPFTETGSRFFTKTPQEGFAMPEEQQQPQEEPEEQQTEEPQEGDTGKTFDSDYVDKLRKEAAKYRTEARQNAAAAKRLQELEDSQKSELQKWQERAESAEGAFTALQTAQQIRDVKDTLSQKYGIPAEALRGSDPDDLEEHAKILKGLLPERIPGQVPAEGRTVRTGSGDPASQFASIISNQLRG